MNSCLRMLKGSLCGWVIFLLFGILAGCKKDNSSELLIANSPLPDAIYSLIPSATSCSDAITSGDFFLDSPVDISNKLSFSVYVSKTGKWSYTTQVIDGVSFSGSGNFQDTGFYSLVLHPLGKPEQAGIFNCPFSVDTTHCQFFLNVKATTDSTVSDNSYHYKATIAGISYVQAVTNTNGCSTGSIVEGNTNVDFAAGIGYSTAPVPAGATSMTIYKGLLHNYDHGDDDNFKSFFNPGDYNYPPPGTTMFQNGDGIAVVWIDLEGKTWGTSFGSADQTGSNFKIISVDELDDDHGDHDHAGLRVKMQFNCKLYRKDSGQMIDLKNGEFIGIYSKN